MAARMRRLAFWRDWSGPGVAFGAAMLSRREAKTVAAKAAARQARP